MKIKTFKAWGVFVIVSFIASITGAAVIGFILGGILGAFNMVTDKVLSGITILGMIFGGYISWYFYGWSIKKYIAPQFEEIDLTHELRIEASGMPEDVQKEIKEISENNNLTYGERFEAIQEVIEKREAI